MDDDERAQAVERIVRCYPTPIAESFRRVAQAGSGDDAHGPYSINFVPTVLRFLAAVLLADFARRAASSKPVAKALVGISRGRDTDGRWLELVKAVADSLKPSSAAFVPELVSSMSAMPGGDYPPGYRMLRHLNELRNEIVHRTRSPSPAELLQSAIDFLATQSWMTRYALVVDDREPPLPLSGASPPICVNEREQRSVALLQPGGAPGLPLGPFAFLGFCPRCADEGAPTHEVFLFTRSPKGGAPFAGVMHNCTADAVRWEQALLGTLERLRGSPAAESLDPVGRLLDRAASISMATLKRYREDDRYDQRVFVEPPGWSARVERLLDDSRPGLLLAAPAGSGKSMVLCSTAERLMQLGHAVLFWSDETLEEVDLAAAAIGALGAGEATDLIQLATFISSRCAPDSSGRPPRLVILVDAPNEREDWPAGLVGVIQYAQDVAAAGQGMVCKVIAAVRDTALEDRHELLRGREAFFCGTDQGFAGFSGAARVEVSIEAFDEDQRVELFRRYQRAFGFRASYSGLPEPTRRLLAHPLMMRLAAAAYSGSALPLELHEEDLFDRHLRHRFRLCTDTQKRQVRDLLSVVAWRVFQTGDLRVPVHLIRGSLEDRLGPRDAAWAHEWALRAGLLSTGPSGIVDAEPWLRFTFERYTEYMLGSEVLPALEGRLGMRGLAEELECRSDALNQAVGALQVFLRRRLRANEAQGREAMRIVLQAGGTRTSAGVADLIAELELERRDALADRLYEDVENLARSGCAACATVLERVHESAFDVGRDERLLTLGNRLRKLYHDTGNERGEARTWVWLGDVHYNRRDDYHEAARAIIAALRILRRVGSSADDEMLLHQAKYALARVLSDDGKNVRAGRLAHECLAFFSRAEIADESEARLGRALAHFLVYMIEGDAAGRFAASRPHLETARQLVLGMPDATRRERALARLAVTEAIAALATEPFGAARAKAHAAIRACRKTGDIQSEAYANLNLAALCCQKAMSLPEPERAGVIVEAYRALLDVRGAHASTVEEYLDVMSRANRAVLALVRGRTRHAEWLLRSVIEESRRDFFNRFDASVLLEGAVRADRSRLAELQADAEKHRYAQGQMHVLWQRERLERRAGAARTADELRSRALGIADELGWGHNPNDSLYMGFYAGVFL